MKRYIVAIDPGSEASAYCQIDADTMAPIDFGKIKNTELLNDLYNRSWVPREKVDVDFVIERIASYGMPVGKDVFETAEWYGRFHEAIGRRIGYKFVHHVYRREEKLILCGNPRAKDTNIRHALIDRFAQHDFRSGRGTKDNPDWFYGFKADIWAAYAVGVTWSDIQKGLL